MMIRRPFLVLAALLVLRVQDTSVPAAEAGA